MTAPDALAACMPSMMSGAVVSESDGEDAAGMKPAHAAAEDSRPVEVAGFEQSAGFVRTVIEDDGRAHSKAAVAVNGGDIGPADAVVLEPFVERRHTGFAHAALHELADRVVDHGRGDAGFHSETVSEAGGHVVFASGDVNLDRPRLPERNHAGVEPMHERPKDRKSSSQGSFRIESPLIAVYPTPGRSKKARSRIVRLSESITRRR